LDSRHAECRLLRADGITLFGYNPDSAHAPLIRRALADPAAQAVALTTEEEGVALVTGADLGGRRAVLLIQSSGVGNCVNALTMVSCLRSPFLAIVTMRGEFGDPNPWQYRMGQATEAIFRMMDIVVLRIRAPEEVTPCILAALNMNRSGVPVAVLVSQSLIGMKR
jgi:sulfopyruvate decarboxylase TPP-binding subunit